MSIFINGLSSSWIYIREFIFRIEFNIFIKFSKNTFLLLLILPNF